MILGESFAIKELKKWIDRVSSSKTNVLILGESGTGKELVARQIHQSGPFKEQPFVAVNCGAIPENLIESEMFGHQKGSFTGAVSDKKGLFEVADQGTLFLDEVGELSLPMQVKLLRVIQERVFRRVGGLSDIRVDVRIIAATNRDLEREVQKGAFREDLYYRLNVLMVRTPPLRERKGDIPILAHSFLKRFAAKASKSISDFDSIAMGALESYDWPGNVRELENLIERAVTLESTSQITLESLPVVVKAASFEKKATGTSSHARVPEIRLPAPDFSKGKIPLEKILTEVEKTYLLAAIKHAGGVKKEASDSLGMSLRSLRYRLQKLGLENQ